MSTPPPAPPLWHHVFLADLTAAHRPRHHHRRPGHRRPTPTPTPDAQSIRLHLINGGQHQHLPHRPEPVQHLHLHHETDFSLQLDTQDDTHSPASTHLSSTHSLSPNSGSAPQLSQPAYDGREPHARIEFNNRFSYPFACLVLMLIGVPLGLSSKRGGKSTGFVLTLLLVFTYYLLSHLGVAFAKSGKLSPFLGVWGANLIFAAFGAILL